MKAKTMRRALFTSILSLLLCVSMLVGTTFAWFTDEVVSGNNLITAGNLDVELYYQVEGGEWTKVTETTNIFMKDALWEPGHTEVVKLKVVNEGTLALKYQLGVNVASETSSVNVAGKEFKLSDYIKFGVVEGEKDYTRDEAVAAVDATATALNAAYNNSAELLPKANDNTTEDVYTDIVTMVVYMPTSVDNVANHAKGAAVPTINLGIKLFATQYTYEEDSFDETYDDIEIAVNYDALYNYETYGNSGNFILTDDVALGGIPYFGDNTSNTIDLNGNTIATKNGAYFMTMGAGSVLAIGGEGVVTTENNYAAFVTESSKLKLNGGTYELAETDERAHFFVQNSATLVINDGEFISDDANTPIAYCINGFIEINGGFFQNTANSSQALLSMGNNLSYVNNQKITLRGGTFVNWNPMDSAFAKDWPQCPALIVLADGYKMISETQANGDVWYMVVPA